MPPDSPARASQRRHTALVLAVALGLRLLVLWTVARHYPAQWLYTRGMEMGSLAKSLVEGQGLSSPFGVPTGPTAFIAPVYPIAVSVVFRLFGTYSTASALAIECAQVLLNLITIALIMGIARRLFNERSAVVAGLIWACSFPLIWMPTIFWETSLSACLLTGLLAFALGCADRPGRGMWLLLGMYGGVTALVNPALLLSVIAVAAWLWHATRKQARLWPLASVLVFLLVFSPWPIRNARAFHAFIPLRTTVGMELWMGNRAGATGFLDESVFPTFNAAELADYKRMGEVGYCQRKSDVAKAYIAAHPGTFLKLSALRFKRFWTGTGTQNGSALFAVHAIFTTVFGFCGLWLLYRSRGGGLALLFALPLALFPLPYYITHAEFRYRILIDPLLAIMAGYALTRFASSLAQKEAAAPITAEPQQAWSPR